MRPQRGRFFFISGAADDKSSGRPREHVGFKKPYLAVFIQLIVKYEKDILHHVRPLVSLILVENCSKFGLSSGPKNA
ncbi:hypothetical protein GLGR_2524 [Leminorella grimontii ATCC 33999 = DSM 5078]|nr:hypothetical protein GLGR_2524 [Leminorella grimontii ATCC 33999 = DSM 5078]